MKYFNLKNPVNLLAIYFILIHLFANDAYFRVLNRIGLVAGGIILVLRLIEYYRK